MPVAVYGIDFTPGTKFRPYSGLVERFWNLVSVASVEECWPWRGVTVTGPRKYGKFAVKKINGKKTMIQAHRVAYAAAHGQWPKDHIDHECCNPPCVNPAHLKDVTRKRNMELMIERGRNKNQQKESCPKGHPYDGVRIRSNSRGQFRFCTICRRAQGKEESRRHRARLKGLIK